MKTLLAAAIFLGSTVGTMAVESYKDYQDYFDAKPVSMKRAPRSSSKMRTPVDIAHDLSALRRPGNGNREEMNRYVNCSRPISDLRPHTWDGGYVPARPNTWSPDGFWGPIVQSHDGHEPPPSYQVRSRRDRAW